MSNNNTKVTACQFCTPRIEAAERNSLEYSQWNCSDCAQLRQREEYKGLAARWAWNLTPAEVAQQIRVLDLDEEVILGVIEEEFDRDTRWSVEDTLGVL